MIEYFNLDFIAGICSMPLKILTLWMRIEQVIAMLGIIGIYLIIKALGKTDNTGLKVNKFPCKRSSCGNNLQFRVLAEDG